MKREEIVKEIMDKWHISFSQAEGIFLICLENAKIKKIPVDECLQDVMH